MRNTKIDILRGIAIILVVGGHIGIPYSGVFFRFHMAVFFIISGMCFSDKHIVSIGSVGKYILGKIKGLYIPFVLFNGVTQLLKNILININFYTNNEKFLNASAWGGNAFGLTEYISWDEQKICLKNILCFYGETQLGGVCWFLRVAFGVSILWIVTNYIVHSFAKFSPVVRFIINMVIACFLLYIASRLMQSDIRFSLSAFRSIASAYIMFVLGYYLKLALKKYSVDFSIKQEVVIMLLALSILCYCDFVCTQNHWESNVNVFNNSLMYICSSLTGFFTCFSMAGIIQCHLDKHFLDKNRISHSTE